MVRVRRHGSTARDNQADGFGDPDDPQVDLGGCRIDGRHPRAKGVSGVGCVFETSMKAKKRVRKDIIVKMPRPMEFEELVRHVLKAKPLRSP